MSTQKVNVTSWGDRFAIMDAFKPSADMACAAFGVTQDELATANELRQAGTLSASKSIDVSQYANHFAMPQASTPAVTITAPVAQPTQQVFAKPETATKKPHIPQKRGRKGSNIKVALHSVPTQPVEVEAFRKQFGVSLAVLRQAKRFGTEYGTEYMATMGTVNVKLDKTTKKLMIWKS
jgi:hypothetical protein